MHEHVCINPLLFCYCKLPRKILWIVLVVFGCCWSMLHDELDAYAMPLLDVVYNAYMMMKLRLHCWPNPKLRVNSEFMPMFDCCCCCVVLKNSKINFQKFSCCLLDVYVWWNMIMMTLCCCWTNITMPIILPRLCLCVLLANDVLMLVFWVSAHFDW